MAQFKDLEPYRWPGLFVAAIALVYAIIVALTFVETRRFSHLKTALDCECVTGLKLSMGLKSGWKVRLLVSLSFIAIITSVCDACVREKHAHAIST